MCLDDDGNRVIMMIWIVLVIDLVLNLVYGVVENGRLIDCAHQHNACCMIAYKPIIK